MRDFSNKMDRKFDRMLYRVIRGLVGLVAKGGLDYYLVKSEKQQDRGAKKE